MPMMNAFKIKTLCFAVLFGLIAFGFVFAQTPAPLGTYTAATGTSMVKGKAAAADEEGGRFKKKFKKQTEVGAGDTITIVLTSYSTKEEISQLKAAQGNPQQFMSMLSSFQHGTVTMGGKSFPINLASSKSRNDKYAITILSSKAFSDTGGQFKRGKGMNTGHIELLVDAAGTGKGVLHTSTKAGFDTQGEVSAMGGGAMSKATELTSVSRK